MLFNSLQFALFGVIVFILYWALPHKFRWMLMLIASYWFYMSWNPWYVILILFTTFVSYLAAIIMEKQGSISNRRWILAGAAFICLGVLFFFKYFNFASETAAYVLNHLAIQVHPYTLKLILPVGISFYTFQTLSYVVDVYRGEIEAEHHFGKYATFVSFFPQLVAGPIERTNNLLPQIKSEHIFDYDLASYGLKQMAWGYFKKIVIADTISQYVGKVYDAPQGFRGFSLVFATLLFTIQIYCDFSGYSDIAIGVAKLMGIKLMTNFKSPYFSQSIREFWSRWHISLSTWFRDYVYIPLGGNRVGKLRNAINLMITFLVSGLWHGANWTFVIWGGVHGVAQILENILVPKKKTKSGGIVGVCRTLIVFFFCAFAWIFFASDSLGGVLYILRHMFDGVMQPITYFWGGVEAIGMGKKEILFLVPSLLLLFVFDYISLNKDVIAIISSKRIVIRWSIYILFVLWMIFNIPVTDTTEFIYFQF